MTRTVQTYMGKRSCIYLGSLDAPTTNRIAFLYCYKSQGVKASTTSFVNIECLTFESLCSLMLCNILAYWAFYVSYEENDVLL
jgi:hypothetical protein